MKKFLSMIAAVVAVFTFAACGGDEATGGGKLSTPVIKSVDATEAGDGFTVTWGAVKGATDYVIMLKGTTTTYTTKETSYTTTGLTMGKYSPMVKAVGAGHEDSDFSLPREIEIKGAAEVDWFTMSVFLPENNEENANRGCNSSNTVAFNWKGNGVTDLYYALFETAELPSSRNEIINELEAIDPADGWLTEINSAAGLSRAFVGACYPETSYTLCVVAYKGQSQFFAMGEVTTDPYIMTTAVESWCGTWSAYTEQMIHFGTKQDAQGNNVPDCSISDKVTEFELVITPEPTEPGLIWIDGLSEVGLGLGVEAYAFTGYTQEGYHAFYIMNNEYLSNLDEEGYALTYLSYCSFTDATGAEDYSFIPGGYPSMFFYALPDEYLWEPYVAEADNGIEFTVQGMEVVWLNPNTYMFGFINIGTADQPVSMVDFKYGPITLVEKTADYTPAAQTMSAKTRPSFGKMPESMVIAF